jgi:hypothetical protein
VCAAHGKEDASTQDGAHGVTRPTSLNFTATMRGLRITGPFHPSTNHPGFTTDEWIIGCLDSRTKNGGRVASAPGPFGFFAKHLVNDFSEFAVSRWPLFLRDRGDFRFEFKHEGLQPLTTGLEFLNGDLQFPDFLPQDFRDFCFVHDQAAKVKSSVIPPPAIKKLRRLWLWLTTGAA